MVIENKRFINADDVLGMQYECNECHTRILAPKERWQIIHRECPRCMRDTTKAQPWFYNGDELDRAIAAVQQGLKIISDLKGIGCRISFEINANDDEDLNA
jgi:hypothetical protein